MIAALFRKLLQLSRRLWVRVLMIAALSILAVPVAALFGPMIPEWLDDRIGASALDPILQVLASSMLAVTTFSLTIMTGAFRASWAQWSPRTHVILKDDTTTHSVLATFVGAFLFALTAIVLRATDFFGRGETVVLFGFTMGVIVLIVVSIIRWIAHLEQLGSLTETGKLVQDRAARAMRALAHAPCYGARPLGEAEMPDLSEMVPVRATRSGFIRQVYQDLLQERAAQHAAQICVLVRNGAYVNRGTVLARISTDRPALLKSVRDAIEIASDRSFVQDPGFGVQVLAEIGCRALSSGINDPQTAIEMVHRLSSVLLLANGHDETEPPRLDRVWLPAPDMEDFFRTSFDRIARDAGGMVEVHLALQAALVSLAGLSDGELRDAARQAARRCRERARLALRDDPDLALFDAAAPG